MPGQLFTQYFLTDGIRHAPEWRASVEEPQAFAVFAGAAAECFEAFGRYDSPNESVIEQELIRLVLTLLGWGFTPYPSRVRRVTKTSPTTCCSPTSHPRLAPPGATTLKHATGAPCQLKKASASAFPLIPGTRPTNPARARHTGRFAATCPPPTL